MAILEGKEKIILETITASFRVFLLLHSLLELGILLIKKLRNLVYVLDNITPPLITPSIHSISSSKLTILV